MSEAQKPASQPLSFADILGLFRTHTDKFRADLTKVREQLEHARRRREDLQVLPPPPAEVCDRLLAILDRRAAEYQRTIMLRVKGLAGECAKPDDSQGLQMSMQLVQNPAAFSGWEMEGLLVFMFRDEIRAGMLKAIQAMGLKHGPTMRERAAELEKLDAQIAELEASDQRMVDELDAIRAKAAS
jgi:hypothetical protein